MSIAHVTLTFLRVNDNFAVNYFMNAPVIGETLFMHLTYAQTEKKNSKIKHPFLKIPINNNL